MSSSPINGASNIRDDPELLSGVLASDHDRISVIYAEDRCLLCEREGRFDVSETCFHRHWETTDAAVVAERRG